MTVKQLKEQLAGVPDDAVLVIASDYYGYKPALVDSTSMRASPSGQIYDFPEADTDEVRAVLLFS